MLQAVSPQAPVTTSNPPADEECPICLEDNPYSNPLQNRIIPLPCHHSHAAHLGCHIKLYARNPDCFNCRVPYSLQNTVILAHLKPEVGESNDARYTRISRAFGINGGDIGRNLRNLINNPGTKEGVQAEQVVFAEDLTQDKGNAFIQGLVNDASNGIATSQQPQSQPTQSQPASNWAFFYNDLPQPPSTPIWGRGNNFDWDPPTPPSCFESMCRCVAQVAVTVFKVIVCLVKSIVTCLVKVIVAFVISLAIPPIIIVHLASRLLSCIAALFRPL